MRRRLSTHRFHFHAPSNRVAWWAAFLATIAAIAILNLVRSANAAELPGPAAMPPAPPALGLEETEEEEEETEAEEEAEEEESGEEWGFGEESECEEEGELCEEEAEEEVFPPRECLLESTDAAVAALPHNRVQLTIRYKARVPAQVALSYRLQGPRGALNLGSDRHRFLGRGTVRQTEHLSHGQMTRVLAARSFNLTVRPLGAPRYCHSYFDQRLSVKRSTRRGPVWLGPESSFRIPGRP